MADNKELEPQKAKQFQPPNLLTSKVNEPSGPAHGDQQYRSVSQKAKLILPTALWILIVVAGLCFLSLLSSLNKSINTLDTLVEIEQANAKHRHGNSGDDSRFEALESANPADSDQHHQHPHPHHHHQRPEAKSSWLSLPSWTSLEPTAHHRSKPKKQEPLFELVSEHEAKEAKQAGDKMFSQIMDDVMRDLAGGADAKGNKLEEIIIASSALPIGDNTELGSMFAGMDSLINQIRSPFGGSKKQSTKVNKNNEDDDDQRAKVLANIDTVNIHFNNRDTQAKRPNAGAAKKTADLEDSIEKMLDEINGNLRGHAQRPIELPETILIPLGNSKPHSVGSSHVLHQSPATIDADELTISPLSKLLIPSGLRLHDEEQVFGSKSLPLKQQQHHFNLFGGQLPAGVFEQNANGPFVLQLGASSGKASKSKPAKSLSPYELRPLGEQQSVSGSPVDLLSSNLANSLLRQTLFPFSQESSSAARETVGPSTVSEFEFSPVPSPTRADNDLLEKIGAKNRKNKNDQVDELLSLFFGPAPNSSLSAAPQVVEPKSDTIDASQQNDTTETGTIGEKMPSTIAMPTEVSSAATPTEHGLESSPSAASTADKQNTGPTTLSVDPQFEDFLGSMFSLPQMSGQSGPSRADSQQAGNSNSNRDSTVATIATETPQTTGPNTNATAQIAESSVEKVFEVVEPAKEITIPSENPVKQPLHDLFATLLPDTQIVPVGGPIAAVSDLLTQANRPESKLTSEFLKASAENDKAKPESGPAEIEIFQQNKSLPSLEAQTSIKAPSLLDQVPTTTSSQPTTQTAQGIVGSSPDPAKSTTTTERPAFKSFLKRADDFIERNLVNFKRLLA